MTIAAEATRLGWGRELGEGAIAEYTQTKAVNMAL
jgi:phenylacetaldehyde dehydrogenase